MLNYTKQNLLISEIYLSLNDTNSISPDLLTQYKTMVTDIEKPEETKSNILRLISSYVDKASKALAKELLLQHCNTILNTINTNLTTLNVNFHLKKLEYTLCDQLTPMSDRIAILKACIAESASESIDEQIECMSNLLDIYLINPNEYLEDIRTISSKLKSLVATKG